MKKLAIIVILLILGLSMANAQGFYFDIGLGVGAPWTRIDGENVYQTLRSAGVNLRQYGVDVGFKAGYGPIANLPLYGVGVFSVLVNGMYDSRDDIQFSSFIIGPGVIYYPIPLIQLAGSVGYSLVNNSSSFMNMYSSRGGFGWDISAAVDLGRGNHGALLGLKYSMAINTLRTSGVTQNQSILSVFVRYTFRQKLNQ